MPVIVNRSGVWRLPFPATYLSEKSWRRSADSMATTPSTAPATITHVYLRPASSSLASRRYSPRPSVTTPTRAPKSPSPTLAVPNVALNGPPSAAPLSEARAAHWSCAPPLRFGARSLRHRRRRHRHPRRMLGDVVLGVLHHDAVAGEAVALKMALQDDGDAGLEELGRVALVIHGDDHTLALDVERRRTARLPHRAGDDVALDAEAAAAELLLLGHGFIGGAEVERGVAQTPNDQEAEGDEHDQAGDRS